VLRHARRVQAPAWRRPGLPDRGAQKVRGQRLQTRLLTAAQRYEALKKTLQLSNCGRGTGVAARCFVECECNRCCNNAALQAAILM
jgi:hypothetical protein